MRIANIEIKNFRSIRHLSLDFGKTTVLIGPNNAGKTAILDAIQVALPHYREQRGKKFNKHDIHLNEDILDPKESDGAEIKLTSEVEGASVEDLGDIVQIDLNTDLQSITLRTQYRWDNETEVFHQSRGFLNEKGEQLVSSNNANRTNLNKFRQYLPVFYLGALRTIGDEFSSRSSQFWKQLLKVVKIPPQIESETLRELNQLDEKVLASDPHLKRIADTLSRATEISVQSHVGGNIDLRTLPSDLSEILSRVQIILRHKSTSPWLPTQNQGEGMQSLLVVFLFQAFVECLLGKLYGADHDPILLLEEPETHLHPHAVRSLWTYIDRLPGQKIITTHSPYFVQHVPFRDLRLVRLSENGTKVYSLPEKFSAAVPQCDAFEKIVTTSEKNLKYHPVSGTFTVTGKLDENIYRKLLTCYGQHEQRGIAESALSSLMSRSLLFISDEVLRRLETQGKRLRGEIFFSEGWLIVEGPSDFMITHAMAHALGLDLDRYGVSVIDAKNHGNPASFALLSRALDIPCQGVFDGDEAGEKYKRQINNYGLSSDQINGQCHIHEAGDLEAQLVSDGFRAELSKILKKLGVPEVDQLDDRGFADELRKKKRDYAPIFAKDLRHGTVKENQLIAFQIAIKNLCG